MKKIYRPKKSIKIEKKFYINQQIRANELRLIDENGEMLGIFPLQKALEMATEKELDLVEISPKANPPVAKIIDYGKLLYQQEKMLKKQKSQQKKIDVKGIRLSQRISQHDLEIRIEQAKKFLEKGQKVKIDVVLRGREMQYAANVRKLMQEFLDKLDTAVTIEQPLSKQGNRFSMQVAPKNK